MQDVVGRGPEIAKIVHWFRSEGPATLVLDGPAGLGKTTVWAASVARVQDDGARIVRSIPSEAESQLSYAGLADLLGADFPAIQGSLPGPQARALAVAMRLEAPGDQPPDETAVARGLLHGLRAMARSHAVLVAIDDLRWLDAPTLTAVVYAMRRLEPHERIRILATHRTGAVEPAGLAGADTVRLRLEPMSVGGIHRIVRRHIGISLPRPRLLEVHAASLGNPLHALELARTIGEGSSADDGSLGGLFLGRIAALPLRARAAVVLMAASSDRSIERLDRARPGAFAAAIAPAVGAGLVAIGGGRAWPIHPLVGHLAYEAAEPAGRRAAHRALADSAASDEERALHLGRAADGPDGEAADAIEIAAHDVRARGVRAQSATLFESAARLTPAVASEARARRSLAAAIAWFEAGDTDRVEAILRPLMDELGAGAVRAEAGWRLGIALDESGRWREATELWRRALAETDDPGLRSQVQCSLGITAMYTESVERALTWAESAVAEVDGGSDARALARSLAVYGFVRAMSGAAFHEVMDRALALEATTEEPLGEWSPSALAAECARHIGDVGGARRHYTTVLERAVRTGDANVEQWAAFGLASAEIVAGGYRRASELADTVLDIADQTGVMGIPARWLRAHCDAYLGELDEARTLVAEALQRAVAADETLHRFSGLVVLGTIQGFAGDLAGAARTLAEARGLGRALGLAHAAGLRTYLYEVELAAAIGELGQVGDAMAAFDETVGAHPPLWSGPIVRRARAAVLAATGDLAGAIDELQGAVADPDLLAPDRGRTLLSLGSALRRSREYRRARAAIEQARDIFVDLESPPWIDAARRELARVPGRRSAHDGDLTEAEARIAGLVAQGRTNRDVASELVLSVKTIEVTLTRIYQKLGVRTRAEMTARLNGRPVSTQGVRRPAPAGDDRDLVGEPP